MPGADEGAFERFLASALATILTIIFSWHIIIDVYDDSKRRRQIDSTPPSPSTSSSTSTSPLKSPNVAKPRDLPSTSKEPVAESSTDQNFNSVIKEYRLTPSTISRLEAVPDPIELITQSADKPTCGSNQVSTGKSLPVLSDRLVPEQDSLDTKPLNRDLLRVANTGRLLASPDDFDSVPLESSDSEKDSGSDHEISVQVVRKKERKMFDESWDMDDGDFDEIYGEEESDRRNPRDYFYMSMEDSDDDHYWPKQTLDAISEEDEDDVSSECNSDDEDHFSDDSLNVQESPPKDQNLNSIKVIKSREESITFEKNSRERFEDSYFDLTTAENQRTPSDDGSHSNARQQPSEVETEADMDFSRRQKEVNLFSPLEYRNNNRFSPSLSDQTRQLCSSLEGLNRLDPSLSSKCDSGIVGRAFNSTMDKLVNGDLNISNFDDSKLELLDDSYRDSKLSDCSKPPPRGFIFSRTQELDKEETVSSNFIEKEGKTSETGVQALDTQSSATCVQIENQNGGDRYYQSTSKRSESNNSISTVNSDSVYVIDLNSDHFHTQECTSVVPENFESGISENCAVDDNAIECEVNSELLAQEEILDTRIIVTSDNNSSGDESSTTTGETAILNPGKTEFTDDDVSEISEIDIDVINELRRVALEPFRSGNRRQVTDLDASSSDSSDEHSSDNSDSSASFDIGEPDVTPEPEVPKRNLDILDELEEEELSTSDSEEFQDAQERKFDELASSGSGSSVEGAEFIQSVSEHTAQPLQSTDNQPDNGLRKSPYFHTQLNENHTNRSIVRRLRHYPGLDECPELGFFTHPDMDEKGSQTIQSYRQPAKCTIDPERYFRPFTVDSFPFTVTTEYSNGDVEVQQFVDVGVQIRFDPLWDKSEQRLVLSPTTTPTRGSPVNVEKEGKLKPKELVFQWPENEGDSVFPDNFEPAVVLSSDTRRRRPSTERRASYDAIDESEEDLLEDSSGVLDSPPKGTPPRQRSQDSPKQVSPLILDTQSVDYSSENKMDTSNELKAPCVKPVNEIEENILAAESKAHEEAPVKPRNGVTEVLTATEISTKVYTRSSSDEEEEQHRSPPKRRHRKPNAAHHSPTKTPPRNSFLNSSSEEEKLVVEKVHVDDSSDADDESDDEARVPLFAKGESPITSPNESKEWTAPAEAFIQPITAPRTPPAPNSPRNSPHSPSRVQISPRPRPQPRVKTAEFISSNRKSPIEGKTNLYNQFNRPSSQAKSPSPVKSPPKSSPRSSPSENTEAAPRLQSSMNIQLSSVSKPTPLARTEIKIDGPTAKTNTEKSKTTVSVPLEPKKYSSALLEPIQTENKNISHLFTLPEKTTLPEREKILHARQDYMQTQENEAERKKLLSRLLGTRDWSERDVPKPKSILKKPSQTFESKADDLPLGYKPTSLDTPNLAKMCKSTENIKERISRVVERRKEEDRERSRSRSNSRGDLERGRAERRSFTLPPNFQAPSRSKSLDSLMDGKSLSLPRSDSRTGLYRSPSITLNKEPISFFSDRRSYTNLLETDIDNDARREVPLIKETDLDSVSRNLSTQNLQRVRSKSETRDSLRRPVVREVYDDHLEKTKSMEQLTESTTISLSVYGGTPEIVPVTKDNSRLSKSLGQLDLPDWYVNAPRKPEDVDFGLRCTKTPPSSSSSTSFDQSKSFRSTNTSFDGPRSTILNTRVSPPRRTPSPKPLKPFELPSERFRKSHVPMTSRKIVSKMRPPGSKSMENLSTKEMSIPSESDRLSHISISKEKEMPKFNEGIKIYNRNDRIKPDIQSTELDVKRMEVPTLYVPEVKSPEVVKQEVSPPEMVKPEGRFKSSATVQLKPSMPPKPLVKPPPVPKPVVSEIAAQNPAKTAEETARKPGETTFNVQRTTPIQPGVAPSPQHAAPIQQRSALPQRAAPPPPIPSRQKSPPRTVLPIRTETKVSSVDIPFADDSPQDEEAPQMNFPPAQPVTSEPVTVTMSETPTPEVFRQPNAEVTVQAPSTLEIQAPQEVVLQAPPTIRAPDYSGQVQVDPDDVPVETPLLTEVKLRSPAIQAACKPMQPKAFSTTPTEFYALNVIDTDLDTSATMSPPRPSTPQEKMDYMKIAVHDLTSGSDSAKEAGPLERKWAPQEANVGVQIRRGPLNIAPIETNLDEQRSSRYLDEPTPRSPRETSFVSRPSPKVDSNPSSPRETSFLSKGKERSHFVFPKPASPKETTFSPKDTIPKETYPKETNFGAQETNIDDARPYQPRRPTEFRQQPVRPAAEFRPQYQAPKPQSTVQRPQAPPVETSIDASPMIRRNERHPPNRPSPIPNVGRPGVETGWKTSTPIVRNQDYRTQRLPSRETDIDGDIVQQPRSPPMQFEKTLESDSFRFNAPQSESTPLNMSLETSGNQVRPGVETNIDADLPARPPPRREPPPRPYRQPRPPPPAPSARNGLTDRRSVETDIDSDLTDGECRKNGPRFDEPRRKPSVPSRQSSLNSRPGSVASQTGSISDGYFDPGDLDTFKRMAREDPLVSTSSPRASPLDANFNSFGQPFQNTFGTNIRIDHSQNVYQPRNCIPPSSPSEPESPENTSLVEVLDGLLGMENSSKNNLSDDFSDPNRKRTISEAKFDIFNDINRKLNEDMTVIKCRNSRCGKTSPMRQARTSYVSCTVCYCYYCSEECRSKHYPRHEERCTLARVAASCRLVVKRLQTDQILSHQLCGIARTGYHSSGRGCVTVTLESPLQCDQVVNAGRAALHSQPDYNPLSEFDMDAKIADNTMDLAVDYNPSTDYVLNVCCKVTRRRTELVRHSEIVPLSTVQTPSIAINDKQPREQWFYSVQNKLREKGVDLRRQYPDVYNQIIQYVDRKVPFQTLTIYPVDGNTGRTFLCSISPDIPIDMRPMTWNKPQLGRPAQVPQRSVPPQKMVPNRAPAGRPMYQPPRRAPNVASKETEL